MPDVAHLLSLRHRCTFEGKCPDCGREYQDDVPDTCSDECPGEQARVAVVNTVSALRDELRFGNPSFPASLRAALRNLTTTEE